MNHFDLAKYLTENKIILHESQWGFDLTEFKPGGFQKLLQGLGIPVSPGKKVNIQSYSVWQWSGKGIRIETGNNPITGEYANGNRENEKNYASYMGIAGDKEMVKKAVDLIKKYSTYIKDESPNTRDFI